MTKQRIESIIARTKEAAQAFRDLKREIEELEAKKPDYSYQRWHEREFPKLQAMQHQLASGLDDFGIELERLEAAAKRDILSSFVFKPEELHEDSALLQSGIGFTESELESLFAKHNGNFTMMRLISDTYKKQFGEYHPKMRFEIDKQNPKRIEAEALESAVGVCRIAMSRYDDVFGFNDIMGTIDHSSSEE